MYSIMKQLIKGLALALAMILPLVTLAHPGHDHSEGADGFTITHYLTSPVHLITSLAVVAIAVGIVRAIRRKDQKA